MRRGAPQDQELVGPGAPGRGSRGSPPSSGPVVPVLVFPPDLVFRADQRSGPRQLLTLYNPTGTALRFRGEETGGHLELGLRGLVAGYGKIVWAGGISQVARCLALGLKKINHVHLWGC